MIKSTSITMSNLALKAKCNIPFSMVGNFVKSKAAIIIEIKGMTAFFTFRLNRMNNPQMISRKAVTYNIRSGNGSPKRIKVCASSSLNNLSAPDVMKTYATA